MKENLLWVGFLVGIYVWYRVATYFIPPALKAPTAEGEEKLWFPPLQKRGKKLNPPENLYKIKRPRPIGWFVIQGGKK